MVSRASTAERRVFARFARRSVRCTVGLAAALSAVACGPEAVPAAPPLLRPAKTGDASEGVECSATRPPADSAGRTLEGQGCVANVDSPGPGARTPAAASGDVSGRGPPMMSIAGGRFSMGSNDGRDNEKPVHEVRVETFAMDLTEVTTGQYEACVGAGSCQPAATDSKYCNAGKADRMGHPINCVSWEGATSFCGWAGKRLPTEEEWEYAARGSDGRMFPWGNEAPGSQLCWDRLSTKAGTCAVGSFTAGKSPFGLLDMAGNVWEWTSSAPCPYAVKVCAGEARIARGGSWTHGDPSLVRASIREGDARTLESYLVGFRCVR